jgi:hypothetical protein
MTTAMARTNTAPGVASGRDNCACHPGTPDVAAEPSARERTLRKLPLPYSLALRLRDAGAPPDVICEYLAVPQDRLDGFYRMAEAKFADAQCMTTQHRVGHLPAAKPEGTCRENTSTTKYSSEAASGQPAPTEETTMTIAVDRPGRPNVFNAGAADH